MHVENLAVFDTCFEARAFESSLSSAEPQVKSSLSQVTAVGAICNAATFDSDRTPSSSNEKLISNKGIVGNATGIPIL